MKSLSRNLILLLGLVLLLSAVTLVVLNPTGQTPDNNTTNTTNATPYEQPQNLSYNTIITQTINTHTINYTQQNNESVSITKNGTQIEYTNDLTIYNYENNTTNDKIYAQYNSTESYYKFQNNTTQIIITSEIIGTEENPRLTQYQTQGELTKTMNPVTPRQNISQELNTILTNTTPQSIKTINETNTTTYTTYTLNKTNTTLTVNNNGQITTLNTPNQTITITYNTTRPNKPPSPDQPAINNSTTT